jgi:beta-xylosidase
MNTYHNPVWPGYFADPFVLRADSGYYAYGTGPADAAGRQFPMLHSPDLCNWNPIGGALDPLPQAPKALYWAPEVARQGENYYLYYSAAPSGREEDHRLRVAVAKAPQGPFVDSGRVLIPELKFTIDASPFFDPRTRRWHLAFATDYLQDEPFGTGLGLITLEDDMMTTSGKPLVLQRATAPWQIYETNRNYQGRHWPKWYCVEGPNLLYHNDKYYCLYSGGAWRESNYGVGFAVADDLQGPWRDDFAVHGPAVLHGTESVIGPGHNSVVLAPDNHTLFAVYHAWDTARTARRMCIDPLYWTDSGPKVSGPSTEDRPIIPR